MKKQTNKKFCQRNRPILRATDLLLAVGSAGMISLMPSAVRGGPINGTITGQTATANVGDDSLTSTTIGIGYFTSCYFITDGIAGQGFGAYNFVFAGQGVASGIPNIDPSDFTVSQYAPWVGNNNATMNNVTGPDNANYNRNVTGQESGGANIVISYKPQNASDPTNINFLQAYILNMNNTGFASGKIDNGGSGGPFYNEGGVSGTGTNNRTGTIPLLTSSTISAWLVDIPYTPEWGYSNQGDDTITNEVDTFQTFISSQRVISGTNYNVLYGGIQWGYTFSTQDVPEPGIVALVAGFLGAAFLRRRLRPPA
jgi:hypothetical protein